jgi:hypothetical protein
VYYTVYIVLEFTMESESGAVYISLELCSGGMNVLSGRYTGVEESERWDYYTMRISTRNEWREQRSTNGAVPSPKCWRCGGVLGIGWTRLGLGKIQDMTAQSMNFVGGSTHSAPDPPFPSLTTHTQSITELSWMPAPVMAW